MWVRIPPATLKINIKEFSVNDFDMKEFETLYIYLTRMNINPAIAENIVNYVEKEEDNYYQNGYDTGHDDGHNDGYEKGYEDGYEEGYSDAGGYEE